MHDLFADWYSEAGLGTDAEALEKRWSGVTEIVKAAKRETVPQLVRLAHRLAADSTYADSLRSAFKKADASFLMRNDNELQVLAGAALATLLQNAGPAALAGAALINCLRFSEQKPVNDTLRAAAAAVLLEEAERLRDPDVEFPAVPAYPGKPIKGALTEIEKLTVPPDVAIFKKFVDGVNDALAKLHECVSELSEVVESRSDAASEESDVLWWLFSNWSDLAEQQFADVKRPALPVVIAIELADRFALVPPPPNARAFLRRALIDGKIDLDSQLKLNEVLEATSAKVRDRVTEEGVMSLHDLLPIHAVLAGQGKQQDAARALRPLELSEQLFAERIALRLVTENKNG
ncbi:MAG: GTPase-associated system all-helical protein GASH [Myxococcota bacterium]